MSWNFRLIIIVTIVFGCSMSSAIASEKFTVFVSIAPQKYFVQQIGRDLVDVQIMVPAGADPHTYEPKPQQMVAISRAKQYFAIGIEFEEAHLKKIASTNPRMQVVHCDQGIQKLPMGQHSDEEADTHHDHKATEHHEADNHGHDHSEPHSNETQKGDHHDHGGLDPHIWLSPPLVKIQAATILAALQKADPAHRQVYEANYKEFSAQIDQLDADLRNLFNSKQGLEFMVFHPSWGYFADTYGLQQVPVEIEGKNPKPAQLQGLIQRARRHNIRVVFVQPQFSTKSANIVAKEIRGQVAFVDPLAEDWQANLREVADKFIMALK